MNPSTWWKLVGVGRRVPPGDSGSSFCGHLPGAVCSLQLRGHGHGSQQGAAGGRVAEGQKLGHVVGGEGTEAFPWKTAFFFWCDEGPLIVDGADVVGGGRTCLQCGLGFGHGLHAGKHRRLEAGDSPLAQEFCHGFQRSLQVLLAGVVTAAAVDVHVDEAGSEPGSLCIDDF